jgi:hypothetical protein
MKTYNEKEIQNEILAQQYKYIALFDSNDRVLIPYNNTQIKPSVRLNEVLTRLKSKTLTDGFYKVMAKNSVQKTIVPDVYLYAKGNTANLNESTKQEIIYMDRPNQNVGMDSVISYTKALELNTLIARLELENAQLKREIDDLQTECDELRSNEVQNLADEKPTMLENAKSFLSEILTSGAPLIDKYFEQKDRALAIKESQLSLNRPQQIKPAEQKQDVAKKFINWYEKNNKDSENNVITELVTIYNSVNSIPEFEEDLEDFCAENENTELLTMFNNFKSFHNGNE